MNDENLNSMIKKKNEILKRIEENKRLMELIKNPNILNTLIPAQQMKKISAIKKIQSYWRNYKEKLKQSKQKIILKYSSNHSNNYIYHSNKLSSNSTMSLINAILVIQRSFRKYLNGKYKEKLKQINIQNYVREFFAPLKFDKVNEVKASILNRFKSMNLPDKYTDFQEILNEYYNRYRNFNETFPQKIKTREDNINMYYQSQDLIQHLSKQTDLENFKKYDYIYPDPNKKQIVKRDLDKILESMEHKMWWYKYSQIEDFEEENIVNEIDVYFNFPRRSQILSEK